jgi:alcohol dehydrogenase class IV
MQNFTFETPQKIIFGNGEKKTLPSILEQFGRRVFILTGNRSATDSGLIEKIKSLLSEFFLFVMTCPKGEPSSESIDSIASVVRDFSPDVLVAIGGGSVIDSVKAASGIAGETYSVEEYLEGSAALRQISKPGLPWVAMPTTAGTGAEATKNAVIRSSVQNAKRSLRSPHILAKAAIIDPELTLHLPGNITGATGIDALTQLLESFVSLRSNTIIQSLVRGAFPSMLSALRRLATNPTDREARHAASYGALVSGMALTNSGLGAVHGFASGVGGLYDIPHGIICACFLVPVLRANKSEISDKIGFLLSDFQINKKKDPVIWLGDELAEIFGLYGIPKNLQSYGIDRSNAKSIIEKSKGSSMSGNPRKLSDSELEEILEQVI